MTGYQNYNVVFEYIQGAQRVGTRFWSTYRDEAQFIEMNSPEILRDKHLKVVKPGVTSDEAKELCEEREDSIPMKALQGIIDRALGSFMG